MGVLTWIIFGLIVGAIAKMIMPGNQNMGWLVTIILGIVGAFIGGAIGTYVLHWGDVESFWSFRSWALSVLGAVIVLFIYGKLTKSS